MREALLERREQGDQGTFGVLYAGPFRFFTGELPWRDNKPCISCIPKGSYTGLWTYSPRFKRKMFLLRKAEGRSGIRIHPANLMGDRQKKYIRQLEGCIALGEKIGWLKKQKAILISRPAVRRFEAWAAGETFKLEIC